jgi:hypothetical protein
MPTLSGAARANGVPLSVGACAQPSAATSSTALHASNHGLRAAVRRFGHDGFDMVTSSERAIQHLSLTAVNRAPRRRRA